MSERHRERISGRGRKEEWEGVRRKENTRKVRKGKRGGREAREKRFFKRQKGREKLQG